MNLLEYSFITGAGAKQTDPVLLNEAKEQGFYKSYCKWDNLANQIMLGGGAINLKHDLRQDQRMSFIAYLSAYLTSFTADHAEKVAVCAMLLKAFTVHPLDIASENIPTLTESK